MVSGPTTSEPHLARPNQLNTARSRGYVNSLRSSKSLKESVTLPRKKRSTDISLPSSNSDYNHSEDQENRPNVNHSSQPPLFSNLTNLSNNNSQPKRNKPPKEIQRLSRAGHQHSLLPISITRSQSLNNLNSKSTSSLSLESTAATNVTGHNPGDITSGGLSTRAETHIQSKPISADKSLPISSHRSHKASQKIPILHTRKIIKKTPRVTASPHSSRHSLPPSLNVGHGRAAPNILSTTHMHAKVTKPPASWIPRLASRTNKISNTTRQRSDIQPTPSVDCDTTSLRSTPPAQNKLPAHFSNSSLHKSRPESPTDKRYNTALHELNFEDDMPSVDNDTSFFMNVNDRDTRSSTTTNQHDIGAEGKYGSLKNRVANSATKLHGKENAVSDSALAITDVIDISCAYGTSENLIARNIANAGQPLSVPLPAPAPTPDSSSHQKSYIPCSKFNANPFLSNLNTDTAVSGNNADADEDDDMADIPFSISPSKHTVKITFEDMSVKKAKHRAGGSSPGGNTPERPNPNGTSASTRHVSFAAYRTEKVARERNFLESADSSTLRPLRPLPVTGVQSDKAGNDNPFFPITHSTSPKPSGLPSPLPSPLRSFPQLDFNTSPAQRLVDSVRREMSGKIGTSGPGMMLNQRSTTPSGYQPSGGKTGLRKDAWGCVHLGPSNCELSIRFPQTPHYESWDLEDDEGLFVTVPALLCLMAKPHISWGSSPLAMPDINLLDIRCDAIPASPPSAMRAHKRPRRCGPLHDPQADMFSITYSGIHTGTEMPDRLGHPGGNGPYKPVVRLPSASGVNAGRAFTFKRDPPPMGASPLRGEIPGESIMIEKWVRAYGHPGVEGIKDQRRRESEENANCGGTTTPPPVIDVKKYTTIPKIPSQMMRMDRFNSLDPFLPPLPTQQGLSPGALALLSQSLSNANAHAHVFNNSNLRLNFKQGHIRPLFVPSEGASGWYLKVWIPIPTYLFRKSETKKFRVSARVWIAGDEEEEDGEDGDGDGEDDEDSEGGCGPLSASSSLASGGSDTAPISPFGGHGGAGGGGGGEGGGGEGEGGEEQRVESQSSLHSPLSSRFSYGHAYDASAATTTTTSQTGGKSSGKSSETLPLVADADMSVSVLRAWREMR